MAILGVKTTQVRLMAGGEQNVVAIGGPARKGGFSLFIGDNCADFTAEQVIPLVKTIAEAAGMVSGDARHPYSGEAGVSIYRQMQTENEEVAKAMYGKVWGALNAAERKAVEYVVEYKKGLEA